MSDSFAFVTKNGALRIQFYFLSANSLFVRRDHIMGGLRYSFMNYQLDLSKNKERNLEHY